MTYTVKNLCAGIAESYLRWKWELDEVIKNKPCEYPKTKLDMAEIILYGDLLERWKLWRQPEGVVEVEKKSIKKKQEKSTPRRFPEVIRVIPTRPVLEY